MVQKLLVGLLVALGIYLLIRNLFLKKEETPNLNAAFDSGFDSTEYKNTKQNWKDVSRMETAGWTSKLFVNGFNLWGMKKARKRPNTQKGNQFGFAGREMSVLPSALTESINKAVGTPGQSEWAKYDNLQDSVKDIILWMEYTKFPKEKLSLRDHVEEMKKRSYFVGEDVEEYLGKVVAWKNR